MKERPKTLIVIAGPTAVGKTAVAIALATRIDTDVVSADSRQLFREMTIGTAKPSPEELATVRHHFIDSHNLTDNYDAAQYGRDALDVINGLFKTHDYVVLCGGSGLYIKAVCEGFDDIPEIDPDIRRQLADAYEANGIAVLQEKMKALDPEHFAVIDQQNPHRLMRALEVKIGTGMSIASFRKKATLVHDFDMVKIGLELAREELYTRIDRRMDQMIEAGLFAEAERLYPLRHLNALQTVGYQEIFGFMEGQYDRDEAIRLLKRNSRRYAKRQLTWFKRDASMHWMAPGDLEKMLEVIHNCVKS